MPSAGASRASRRLPADGGAASPRGSSPPRPPAGNSAPAPREPDVATTAVGRLRPRARVGARVGRRAAVGEVVDRDARSAQTQAQRPARQRAGVTVRRRRPDAATLVVAQARTHAAGLGIAGGARGEVHLEAAPFDGMHAATLHEPLGGGHAAGGSSQMPNAHTAPATHCPPGSQVLPFDLYSAAQPPVRASQMPTVHGPSNDEQSRGVPGADAVVAGAHREAARDAARVARRRARSRSCRSSGCT